jgi:hypothetical protein
MNLIYLTLFITILLGLGSAQAQTGTACKPLAQPMLAPAGYSTTNKRPFHLGFTHFPHSTTVECGDPMEANLHYQTKFGDIMTIHEDGFVPWKDALRRWFEPGLTNWPVQYPAPYQYEIYYNAVRRNRLPPSHKVILYMNYMNFHKSALADDRGYNPVTGAKTNIPLPADQKYRFNDDYYVYAYVAHAMYLIDAYRPDYVGYGTENNMILSKIVETAATPDPSDDVPYQAWVDYVAASKRIYTILKSVYPQKKFYFSLQIDDYNLQQTFDFGASMPLYNVLLQAINYTKSPHLYTRYITRNTWHRENLKMAESALDVVAVSTYPYMAVGPNVAFIPTNHFYQIREIAPTKPFAVAETGYIAEPLVFPEPINGQQVTIDGNAMAQAQYVSRLLNDATNQKALFVNWYIARDYDDMWNQVLVNLPDKNLNRIWRDIGIFDGAGNVRFGGLVWQSFLWKGVQQ